ncbi:MAG TPA: biosynthetic arginine decarboxylase [Phycisphaerales bacterium]|nr:biosynthetic arginine decarboxylase [Phycisphaerales bacterium]HMP38129.1 biosynthetic arginine decarboxylase [Phycisphaerales bacterium]
MTTHTTPTPAVARQRPGRSGFEPAWTLDDAAETYNLNGWSKGFFAINSKGHVVVRPTRDPKAEIDLFELVRGLRERGIRTPVLVGFSDLLKRRLSDLNEAFATAIAENGFRGGYQAVYPIKVNQQRRVVEEVREYGREFGFGLEVGSKPELLAVLGMTGDSPDRLIICNGFKEERYIEFVTLAAKLGRNIVPVIENLSELRLIVEMADRFQVRPRIGVRVNLATPGAGRWRHSSGVKAKFGLSLSEVLEVVDFLRGRGMLDSLQLLHCHMGSQIHDIRQVNAGVNELVRVYVELAKLGAGMRYLDVGGGLGVDYDGSQTNFEFSTNYTLAEYASNIVYRIQSVCDEEGIDHPTIVTESGRAMVAQSSVLIFDVLGCNRVDRYTVPPELQRVGPGRAAGAAGGAEAAEAAEASDLPRPILDLLEAHASVSERRLLECYHDALQARDEAMSLFSVGYLSLQHRALADRLFWATCARIREKCREMENPPEELQDIDSALSDTYFCNLSVFQSLPDIWAINQIFPIVPIHRLDERPMRRATLADLTCDSDGKIDRFVDDRDIKKALELHDIVEGDEYYLGAFLVGAYQETLGDLHNLFGDTHVVHVKLDESGQWWIDELVEGDSVREVLSYVQYDVNRLAQEIRRECEQAVRRSLMSVSESQALVRAYERGLAGYTYLERESRSDRTA